MSRNLRLLRHLICAHHDSFEDARLVGWTGRCFNEPGSVVDCLCGKYITVPNNFWSIVAIETGKGVLFTVAMTILILEAFVL
jgi:hypothetical protein